MRSVIKNIITLSWFQICGHLGDMWFWDSVLQSLATVLVGRSALTSQLLTSPGTGPLSSGSTSWTTKGESKDERTGRTILLRQPNNPSHQINLRRRSWTSAVVVKGLSSLKKNSLKVRSLENNASLTSRWNSLIFVLFSDESSVRTLMTLPSPQHFQVVFLCWFITEVQFRMLALKQGSLTGGSDNVWDQI